MRVVRFNETGSAVPSKMGGYKPKPLLGEHASWLVARCHEKDFTISQLAEELCKVAPYRPGLRPRKTLA